jgi:hypothetical protein
MSIVDNNTSWSAHQTGCCWRRLGVVPLMKVKNLLACNSTSMLPLLLSKKSGTWFKLQQLTTCQRHNIHMWPKWRHLVGSPVHQTFAPHHICCIASFRIVPKEQFEDCSAPIDAVRSRGRCILTEVQLVDSKLIASALDRISALWAPLKLRRVWSYAVR